MRQKYHNFGRAVGLAFVLIPHMAVSDEATLNHVNPLAVNFVEDTGAAIRIEAGDELRIASQEIPAAACHLHNNIATDLSTDLLQVRVEKFDAFLDALINGNPDFGIVGGEEGAKLKRLLAELDADWQMFRAAAVQVLETPDDAEAVGVLYSNATMMLDRTYYVLSELEGKYSNPTELLYADAMLIEVSGRQAMLSQRIAFLACKKWSGAAGDDYIEKLRVATDQYNFAMTALLNGAPELGITPPPTEDIEAALTDIADESALIAAKMSSLFETGSLDANRAADLYAILSDKMHKLEGIAHLYAEYSKRVY